MSEAAIPEPPKIVSTKPRHVDVPLAWPVEYDGKVYEKIRIRRVTAAEVDAFIKAVSNVPDGMTMPVPPMVECPIEVFNSLDDDDRLLIEESMLPFLPRRLLEVGASILATAPTSSEK